MQHRIKLSTLVLLAIAAKPANTNTSIPSKVKGIKISNPVTSMNQKIRNDSQTPEFGMKNCDQLLFANRF